MREYVRRGVENMSIDFEQAQHNIQELAKLFHSADQSRNEATTRLQFIDRLLFECLGWERSNCIAEERLDRAYADYSLFYPERLLIIEAKKEGIYFELPLGLINLKYNIDYFIRNSPQVGEAIKQAISYCNLKGTPYGAVCNGHELIAFIAFRGDGIAPLDGRALVFDSLDNMSNNFLLLWQCLSPAGVQKRRLSIELSDTITAPLPAKLSQKILDYPGFKRRNPLQTDLQILSDIFVEDLAHLDEKYSEREFLEQCYCSSGALSQYAMLSKEILRARYSILFQKATELSDLRPARTKKGVTPELVSPDLLAKSLSRRPILLIGDKGVGKTMFIKHLYQVEAPDVFSETLVIYIDFAIGPSTESDLQSFILDEIKNELLTKYNIDIDSRAFIYGVLHGDIKRFEKGIYGDLREKDKGKYQVKLVQYLEEIKQKKEEYLKKCLEHIQKAHRKQIVMFLDNVDQRSDEFQEKTFIIGQSIAANWALTVFISLRPQTFYSSKLSGTLDAYHPRAFTIGPPRVDEVISKRLIYAIKLLDTKGLQLGFSGEVNVKVQSLKDYFSVLLYSFNNNNYLIEFLDNICGGNIRTALEYIRLFIGSGHVNTEKILNKYRETGKFLVGEHEFLRAVVYVDNEHYSPLMSNFMNLFDISTPDGREHFLSSILLSQMHRWTQDSTTEGFINISTIFQYLQSLGFYPGQISWSIERLLSKGLIELPIKSSSTISKSESYYRITTIGAYYVLRLMSRFTYVDAMIVDTPILDARFSINIFNAYHITDRLDRCKIFCDYLDSQWALLETKGITFSWPLIREYINRNIEYINGKLIRQDIIDLTANTKLTR